MLFDKHKSLNQENSWEQSTISNIALIITGRTPSQNIKKYWGGKIPLVTSKDVSSTSGRYLKNVQEHITINGLKSSAAKIMPQGTIIIAARDTAGALVQLNKDMTFNQTCYAVVPKANTIDQDFLYYALKNRVNHPLAYGTIFETITHSTFEDWYIPLPLLSEQRIITSILGTLDNKIELNQHMNQTLEEISQSLFKSWFVDFEPVRAKIDGRWKRGRSHLVLSAHLYDLFPDSIIDSEMGEIPKGWDIKPIDEIAYFQDGLALQNYKPEENESRLPVVKIAQLRDGQIDGKEWAKEDITPECIIYDGDVVFSWSESLLVKVWCGGRAALNQHLFKVTSHKYPKWFYLLWLTQHSTKFQNFPVGKSTIIKHIERHHLSETKCLVPNNYLLNAINDTFECMLAKQIANNIQSRTLIALRDMLLPKLMSGKLQVT